jgi:pSer/pThr/pTyr-binding forkhead associated (FHA) protein
MDDFVDVELIKDGNRTQGRHKLPLKIGRGTGNSIRIGHEPNDQTVSRVHTQIDLAGDRLQITDKSTNGTLYNGRVMKTGETLDFADGDRFEVRGYQFRVSRSKRDPSIPVAFYAGIRIGGEQKLFPIGETLLLCVKSGNGIRFEEAPFTPGTNFQDIIGRQRLEGENLLAVIHAGGKLGVVKASSDAEAPVIVNNHTNVKGGQVELRALDVVSIGGVPVDILLPDMKASRCHNHTCRLLNPYDPHGNCRWCGHRLTEGVTEIAMYRKPR